jgi:hypothetical protein
MTGSFCLFEVSEPTHRRPATHSFHRPRILLAILFVLFFSTLINAQTDDSFFGAATLTAGTDDSTETAASTPAENTFYPSPNPPATPTQKTPSASLETAVNTSPVTIPQPFDDAQLSVTGNFTSSTCPEFMRSFLNETSFQQCVPFSLLLYTSSEFFTLTKSVPPFPHRANPGVIRDNPSPRRSMRRIPQNLRRNNERHRKRIDPGLELWFGHPKSESDSSTGSHWYPLPTSP